MIRSIIGLWLALNLVSLPFPMNWLPNGGQFISDVLFPINRIVANWFGLGLEQTYASDSVIYFIQCLLLLVVSIVTCFGIRKLTRVDINQLQGALKSINAYLLFFFLLKYGLDKILLHQFYQIEPNIAHTNVGQLSKDILFWSSMSSSSFYNTFMGGIEIIAGCLLLFQRTRFLGAIVSLGIMSNVLAINIGFDITVKLLAILLLICSAYITSFYPSQLLLITGIKSNIISNNPTDSKINFKLKNFARGTIVALILFESLLPFVQNQPYNKNQLYGSYLISTNANTLFDNVKRIHFTTSGYLVTEDLNEIFTDYKIYYYNGMNEFRLEQHNYHYNLVKDGEIELSCIVNDSLHKVQLVPINMELLPVYQDEFHVTLESFY